MWQKKLWCRLLSARAKAGGLGSLCQRTKRPRLSGGLAMHLCSARAHVTWYASMLLLASAIPWSWASGAESVPDVEEDPSGIPAEELALREQVGNLNEFSARRRLNSLFRNEQSVFYGVQLRYVNSSRGNLTFARRDLVVVGRIPIVFARVYDSCAGSRLWSRMAFIPR